MYTVLLVDDEVDILNSLKNIIDWPVYGIENVLTARDGMDALQKLDAHPVNLLITDISMPNMDGITLLKQVREKYPHIRCIILSSYSDFSYAKEAIALGVENYLLKPIKSDELDNSIRKCLDNLSLHRQTIHTLLLENVLYRWVTNDISMSEFSERAKHVKINIFFKHYCAILIHTSSQEPLNEFIASFILLVKPSYDAWHFINYEGVHVIILGGRSITSNMIETTLKTVISSNIFSGNLQCYVGRIVNGYEAVAQSYQSALECLMANPFSQAQTVFLASANKTNEISPLTLNPIIEHLTTQPENPDTAIVSEVFQELFCNLSEYNINDLNSYISIIPAKLTLQMISAGLISTNDKDTAMNTAYYFETMPSEEDLLKWFTNVISTCHALAKKHKKTLSPIVISAMNYIAKNYDEHASIKDFSNRHSMNASYFGLLFKTEVGIYFNDYLNQIRINHAIRLLKHSSLKISEICQSCGFANSSYFILCFRKQVGISPVKFRTISNNTD